jgi:hypothetical protein
VIFEKLNLSILFLIFVIRVQDRFLFLLQNTFITSSGIGFRERESSFDFKNALNDYVRYVDRMATAAAMAAARERGEATVVTPRGGEDGVRTVYRQVFLCSYF